MDELEISGKRYLSSRRAAKEHKYHTDYIGQLIRAGKVVGKKVGRAWYVEEDSLNTYLNQEASPAASPAVEKIVAEEFAQASAEVQEEVAVEAAIEIKAKEIVEEVFEAPAEQQIHITLPEKKIFQKPARTLIYVEDDEPLLPVLEGRSRSNADFVSVPLHRVVHEPSTEEVTAEQEYTHESSVEEIKNPHVQMRHRRIPAVPILLGVGIFVLVLAAASSTLLATSINVADGQAASVSLTLK